MKKKFLYEKTSPFLTNRNEISIIKSEKEKDKFYFKTDYYFNNECGKECKNYTTILKLECKIKKLKKIIEELKNTNQYLCFTMDQKEKIFKNLVNDIEHFPVIKKKNNNNNNLRKKSNNKNSVININNKTNNNNNNNNNNFIDDNFFKEKKIFKISLNKKINSSSKKTTKKFITFSNTKTKENNKDDDLFINNNINNNNYNKTNYNNYNNNYNNNNNKNNESNEITENNENNPNFIRKKRFTRINTISFNKTGFFSLKNNATINKDEKDESSKNIYYLNPNNNNNINNNNIQKNKKNPYDEILSLNQLTQKPILQSNNLGISFLSLSNSALYELYTNPTITDLYKLTLNDDDFINEFKNSETNILTNYCDTIGLLIKDFKNAMILIQRIKLFLNSSLNLINSIELGDSASTLIKITTKVLNCERVSLFTYESVTDMLIVHSAEGLKKNQIKVPKDKGIVGHVFMNKEKLKIDDAYQDVRFNKEIDKKTGFRTKNILCYPLIDNDNHCFGAIQAINKKKNFNDFDVYNNYNNINFNNIKVAFDSNDEELFCVLSQQASIILKNNINKGEAELQINRLKLIIKFSVNLIQVKNLIDFNDLTERMLIDAFNASHVQVLFNVNGLLYNLSENKFHKKTNIGIAYYVFQKKVYHICDKINMCSYYNILIDSQTNSNLITYPIIDKTHDEVLIIIQVGSIINMQDDGKKLKENEEMVYETIQIILGEWLNKNKNLLMELNEKYKNIKESMFI